MSKFSLGDVTLSGDVTGAANAARVTLAGHVTGAASSTTVTLAGDVTGAVSAVTVKQLQGTKVNNTLSIAVTGAVLYWTGSSYGWNIAASAFSGTRVIKEKAVSSSGSRTVTLMNFALDTSCAAGVFAEIISFGDNNTGKFVVHGDFHMSSAGTCQTGDLDIISTSNGSDHGTVRLDSSGAYAQLKASGSTSQTQTWIARIEFTYDEVHGWQGAGA